MMSREDCNPTCTKTFMCSRARPGARQKSSQICLDCPHCCLSCFCDIQHIHLTNAHGFVIAQTKWLLSQYISRRTQQGVCSEEKSFFCFQAVPPHSAKSKIYNPFPPRLDRLFLALIHALKSCHLSNPAINRLNLQSGVPQPRTSLRTAAHVQISEEQNI